MGIRRPCAWVLNVSCMALENISVMLDTTMWTLGDVHPMLRLDRRSLRCISICCARGADALLAIAREGVEPVLAAGAMQGYSAAVSMCVCARSTDTVFMIWFC